MLDLFKFKLLGRGPILGLHASNKIPVSKNGRHFGNWRFWAIITMFNLQNIGIGIPSCRIQQVILHLARPALARLH